MKQFLNSLCLAFLVFGCSKSPVDVIPGAENPDNIEIEGTEGGVNLFFPQENALCNLGTDVTPTESTVYFEWESNGSNTYKITIENLFTGNIIQQETANDIIPVRIDRATPFKWYVESVKGSKSDRSPTWQFYNAGPGVQSYAPFPAVIVAPNMAETLSTRNSVTLQWTGSDVDNDIVGYDVYFGTQPIPNIFASGIINNQASVSVASGNIYYWRIITKDVLGNTSESGTFQFKVQ